MFSEADSAPSEVTNQNIINKHLVKGVKRVTNDRPMCLNTTFLHCLLLIPLQLQIYAPYSCFTRSLYSTIEIREILSTRQLVVSSSISKSISSFSKIQWN
ncbi:hypothetical protein CDAR_461591 [Caerostris darwini]|uniref:Uncharacterized protein n=1 Tax=Caerostris darwini TaxID=1538125 RepID=A0AAV4M6I4_9ARAC|nr:hypothetical protein CDAR_461591 [Caerostris darwini]